MAEITAPSAYQIEQAVSAWQQMRAALLEDAHLIVDEEAILSTLAGVNDQRDPFDLLHRLIDAAVMAEKRRDEAAELQRQIAARKKRYDERIDRMRLTIHDLMSVLGTDSERAKLARATMSASPERYEVTDPDKVPADYLKTVTSIDKVAINDDAKVGVVIPGVMTIPAGQHRVLSLKAY